MKYAHDGTFKIQKILKSIAGTGLMPLPEQKACKGLKALNRQEPFLNKYNICAYLYINIKHIISIIFISRIKQHIRNKLSDE